MELKANQKRKLKALGHSLKPFINIGKLEISENLIKKVDNELTIHELVKIKIQKTAHTPVKEAIEKIAKLTNSNILRIIGSTALIYRQNLEKPIIIF